MKIKRINIGFNPDVPSELLEEIIREINLVIESYIDYDRLSPEDYMLSYYERENEMG